MRESPVRAFGSVGGTPVFPARGEGAWIEDVEGTRYIDLVQSWGALLFGHAHPAIVAAAAEAASRGTSFGMPTEGEVELADAHRRRACRASRWCGSSSSGTEAAMSAMRLARGVTGRDLLVKFDGCYHGHSDALLAKGGGSGLATLGLPGSPGVTEGAAARHAHRAVQRSRGDRRAVRRARRRDRGGHRRAGRRQHGRRAARARASCRRCATCAPAHGALLIFDEVITGFRIAYGGAQSRLRRRAGPHRARQGDRRRLPVRGVRRAGGI